MIQFLPQINFFFETLIAYLTKIFYLILKDIIKIIVHMRTEILKLLTTGKELNKQITDNYSDVLSQNILETAKHSLNSDLPNKVNAFLSILNMVENGEKFTPVDSIDDAISLFENEDVQKSIDKTTENNDLTGISPLREKAFPLSEVLSNALNGMESSVQLLSAQIQLGESLKRRGGYS